VLVELMQSYLEIGKNQGFGLEFFTDLAILAESGQKSPKWRLTIQTLSKISQFWQDGFSGACFGKTKSRLAAFLIKEIE